MRSVFHSADFRHHNGAAGRSVISPVAYSPPQEQEHRSSEFTLPVNDLEQLNEPIEEQAEEKLYDIPVIFNTSVERHLDYFKTRGRTHFQKWLNRSTHYLPLIKNILGASNLPEDLAYVAMIESGFRVNAISRKKAAGLWQFIPKTARKYDLRIDHWVDERKDPVKSTHAAARLLKDLFLRFRSWPLVLASYNAGMGNVQRALFRTSSTDFWDLNASPHFWKETREFVPKYMATLIIAKNPGAYGFTVPNSDPIKFEQIVVQNSTDLHRVARQARCTYAQIKALNPEIERAVTPPYPAEYTLRVPLGKKKIFLANARTTTSVQRPWRIQYSGTHDPILDINDIRTQRQSSSKEFMVLPGTRVTTLEKTLPLSGAAEKEHPSSTEVMLGETVLRITTQW